MDFYSENFDSVSDKEYIKVDYHDTPNPYFNGCRKNRELDDTEQKLNSAVTSIFFREENSSAEYEGSDYSPNILNGNLTELRSSVSIEEYIKVSDSSRAFSSSDEMSCLASESREIKSSESDGQVTVSNAAESKASFSEDFKSLPFCNNTGVHASVSNNDDSAGAELADLIKTSSTKDESWEKRTSLIDDSFHSDDYEYSNETVVLSRNLESIKNVAKLTGTSLGNENIESDYRKPVAASTNNDLIQVHSSKCDLGQVVTESSDDEDSRYSASDSDESFSWYYKEPEDFIDESEKNLIPQDAEAQVIDGLVKFSLVDGKRTKSDSNVDDVISLLRAKNDSTVLSSDEESIDDTSSRDELFFSYYNDPSFIDEPLQTEFQSEESLVASYNAAIYPEIKNVMSYDLALDRNLTTDNNDWKTASSFREDSCFRYVDPENFIKEQFEWWEKPFFENDYIFSELNQINGLAFIRQNKMIETALASFLTDDEEISLHI
ncbi:uncharacterized protein TNCT_198831 [Trichonephila clavata]|uniref:Uncharacterized protein n=1 Tax=Trichonephila clavata TaxID=2740835 RepID=A0A8X6LFA3_TRICU|nr:uncharacterized protein TNCT_198831 [Trichonephila clavata]